VAIVSTAEYFVPRLIGTFCRKNPKVDVSLEVLNRDGVVHRLRHNLDDLYIMSTPPADMDLSDDIFTINPIVAIAATADPVTKLESVSLEQLRDSRFILREKGSGTRMAVDRHFRKLRFRPDVRLEFGSNEAIKEAVAGRLGIGVISRHALHGLQKEHGVAVVDVSGFPISSNWHIVHPSAKKLSPTAAAFRTHLLTAVQQRRPQARTLALRRP
jgi:DNA-binding transcriptional LysR family regulator